MIFSIRHLQENVVGLGSNLKTVVDISDNVVANIAQRNGKWIVQIKALLAIEDVKNLYDYITTIIEQDVAENVTTSSYSTPPAKKQVEFYFAPM